MSRCGPGARWTAERPCGQRVGERGRREQRVQAAGAGPSGVVGRQSPLLGRCSPRSATPGIGFPSRAQEHAALGPWRRPGLLLRSGLSRQWEARSGHRRDREDPRPTP